MGGISRTSKRDHRIVFAQQQRCGTMSCCDFKPKTFLQRSRGRERHAAKPTPIALYFRKSGSQGGSGLAFGQLGEEVGVDEVNVNLGVDHADAVAPTSLRHCRSVDNLDGGTRLLPFTNRLFCQASGQ